MKEKRPKKKSKEKINKDMQELAGFLYWRWRYYSKEPDGQDLIDGQRNT
jgi:hypothetical protein